MERDSPGPLSSRVDHSAVWTGDEMIVWGGSVAGGAPGFDDGAAYYPTSDSWRELPRLRSQAAFATPLSGTARG